MSQPQLQCIEPNQFEQENHFYSKAVNAQLHPMVSHFFNLDHARIIKRYLHLNPQVDPSALDNILHHQNKHFFWGGADLFYVTTEQGNRKMVVLETNSCPSGQKSMPPRSDSDEYRGYRFLIEQSFLPLLKKKRLPEGALAVLYDKNYMEASGYAAVLADLTGESVYLIPCFDEADPVYFFFNDGILHAIDQDTGQNIPIRAALRYVTQKPWNRIPTMSKTLIYNSTLVCLAGGRNKLLANKAYELFNADLAGTGLRIYTPETIKDVSKLEVPLWVKKFGGKAVVKNPYSNAGQGVYTIVNAQELADFMQHEHAYDQFIVQSLIGHYAWSSNSTEGKYFHVGTVPDKKGNIYIADVRIMVYATKTGFFPCAVYARRAKNPMQECFNSNSWDVLGTNLSIKLNDQQWDSDTKRLMLLDRKDFNMLGMGIDDLIEGYIQTVLTVIAIDKMAQTLVSQKGQFRMRLFASMDNDPSLIQEMQV